MKRCRHCNKEIHDDAVVCPFCQKDLSASGSTPPSQSSTKKCPYCAEDIQPAAIVCRFCGRDLNPPSPASPNLAEPSPAEAPSMPTPEPIYFPVSATKFMVLSLCTLGIYQLFWFYRNWKLEKARTGEDMWPFWRAVFSPLFANSLFVRIRDRASEASVPVGFSRVHSLSRTSSLT
jgi:uncharacterized CHY-type Zn-finger protein